MAMVSIKHQLKKNENIISKTTPAQRTGIVTVNITHKKKTGDAQEEQQK